MGPFNRRGLKLRVPIGEVYEEEEKKMGKFSPILRARRRLRDQLYYNEERSYQATRAMFRYLMEMIESVWQVWPDFELEKPLNIPWRRMVQMAFIQLRYGISNTATYRVYDYIGYSGKTNYQIALLWIDKVLPKLNEYQPGRFANLNHLSLVFLSFSVRGFDCE